MGSFINFKCLQDSRRPARVIAFPFLIGLLLHVERFLLLFIDGSAKMSGVVFGLVSVVIIVVVVVALLASVYGLSIIMDRFCCCFPWFVPLGTATTEDEANASQEVDNGPIARQAGLRGLRRDERMSVVEAILVAQVSVCACVCVCGLLFSWLMACEQFVLVVKLQLISLSCALLVLFVVNCCYRYSRIHPRVNLYWEQTTLKTPRTKAAPPQKQQRQGTKPVTKRVVPSVSIILVRWLVGGWCLWASSCSHLSPHSLRPPPKKTHK